MPLKMSDQPIPLGDHLSTIRQSTNLPDAVLTLAEAMGDLCRAESAGVFLLDQSYSNLLLFASWSEAKGRKQEEPAGISAHLDADPLCYCLQTGKPYHARIASCRSLDVLGSRGKHCSAFPLIAGGNITLGGVLVAMSDKADAETLLNAETVCAYGAVLLDAILQKRRNSSMLQALHEDLARIQEQQNNARSPELRRILGESAGMRQVRELILKVAPTDASILVTGETGTGKELVADALHVLSRRRAQPFQKINCAAIPAQLLESELFGYKKGAFSGAINDYKGLLRSADGGTVLLDEIGDMPLELQAKLLRFLQDQEVRPLGDVRSYPISVRIVAATNSKLRESIEQGLFRRDLYHRLAAFQIYIPPLRDRQEDIIPLVSHYLQTLSAQHGRGAACLSPQSILSLSEYPFPGNVRELINILESALLSSEGSSPALSLPPLSPELSVPASWQLDLKAHLDMMEQSIIAHTMARFNGNTSKAAGALGMPRSTLNSKLRKSPVEERDPPQGRPFKQPDTDRKKASHR